MAKTHKSKNYENVSRVYEHIMRKVRYDYWADYIYAISGDNINDKSKVLEVASGNCRLAKFLSDYYPKLIATDLSFAMLQMNSKYKLRKVCCDMTSLPFKTKFDLIVSAFDSVNYLFTKKRLTTFLKEISEVISGDGIFTFDVSLEKNSYRHIKDPIRRGTYKGLKYIQETNYNSTSHIHKNIFYITYPDGSVFKEIHTQKIYSFETYFELLDLSGLRVKECYDAFSFKNGSANSPRVQFIAIKK